MRPARLTVVAEQQVAVGRAHGSESAGPLGSHAVRRGATAV